MKSSGRPKWTDMLDVTAKLLGAGAIVAATIVANRYQSSLTATNLLVQREQADSNLRAGMFHDLIGPIVGSPSSKEDIGVDREVLLAELLAFNFHENFALKPLMIHVDDRLLNETNNKMDPRQREDYRESLRFAAQRVVQRQLASLTKAESKDSKSSPKQHTCINSLQIDTRNLQESLKPPPKASPKPSPTSSPTSSQKPCSTVEGYFDDLITIDSPSGIYTLALTIHNPASWQTQRFYVVMRVSRNKPDNSLTMPLSDDRIKRATSDYKNDRHIADHDFVLTRFDFPFSDNTLLEDGTRFSLVIDRTEPYIKRAFLKLAWFPRDYFAAGERPINYTEFRTKLGLDIKQ